MHGVCALFGVSSVCLTDLLPRKHRGLAFVLAGGHVGAVGLHAPKAVPKSEDLVFSRFFARDTWWFACQSKNHNNATTVRVFYHLQQRALRSGLRAETAR